MKTKILIVEDDPHILLGLEEVLKSEGYEIASCNRGDEAFAAVTKFQPTLIVLDVMLPGASGYDICKQLRAKKISAPILMLTAKGQEIDKVIGLDLGADDYVTKPFSIRELLARVKAFLRRQGPESSTCEFGDCRLDLTAHKLFRKTSEVELTAKEFRLLEFFVKRAGRALTRDSILDGVWGNEVIVTDRSVDRCVTTLRSKIEADTRNPLFIRTIRDIGYRFELV